MNSVSLDSSLLDNSNTAYNLRIIFQNNEILSEIKNTEDKI
jgi:hypothetical protein